MKYIRRQTLNASNVFDDTVLQRPDGNIELNPTHKVIINGELELGRGGNLPGPEVTNVMYVTLDGDDSNSGLGEGPTQAKRTIKAAVAAAQEGTTIFVRSGEYYEDNPIRIPPKVSIIGDNLRRTIVRPLNKPVTYGISIIERVDGIVTVTTSTTHKLQLHDRVRIDCLSNEEISMESANIIEIVDETTFKYRYPGPDISLGGASGTVKFAHDLFLVNSQNYLAGMVFKGLQAPAYCINIDKDAIVDTSPYVQNCSNINGPWMRNGEEWIPFVTKQPDLTGTFVAGPRPLLDNEIDPTQVDQYGIDIRGAGGGMLIDGDRYSPESPIKSMVADAFTQVAQGAVGFHITNFGYMQLVSCFSVFCDKAFYTTNGGYLSISNSVCDFGNSGFTADGYYYEPYATGVVAQDYYSTVASITVLGEGVGYTSVPDVFIDPPSTPGGTTATAIATLDNIRGVISGITVIDPGSGYTSIPNVTLIGGFPTTPAEAVVNLQTNISIEINELGDKPQVASVMFLGDDPNGYYISRTEDSTQAFRYNEQKCRRDVRYIVEAVLADAVFGTNHQSVYAGLAYLRSYSSKVLSLQQSQTIDGIVKAKTEVLALITDPVKQALISDNFDIVLNILTAGNTSGATAVGLNPLLGRENGFNEAADILLANREFIKDEITAWISENARGFEYDEAKCSRDVGLIVEAVLEDMILGTTYNSIYAGLSYLRSYASTVTSSQKKQTIDGINRARDIVLGLVEDYNIDLIINSNFNLITNIIQNGPSAAPRVTYTNPVGVDGGTANSVAQLIANRDFIAEEVIAYINENLSPTSIPNYNENVCKRDVKYLVDALAFDLLYNGNNATVKAALAYYAGAVSTVEDEESAFVAAYAHLQSVIDNIILADSAGWTKSASNPLVQNITNPAGNSTSSDTVIDLIQIVVDVVQNGTASAPVIVTPTYSAGAYYNVKNPARLEVLNNISFVQSEVIDYLNKVYAGNFTYNEATCRRDIDYIIDALAYDLTYGGDTQMTNAALAYAEGSVIAGEIQQTIEAYRHWKNVIYDVLRNVVVTPTTGNTTPQNTLLPLGDPSPDYRVAVVAQNLLQIVIDVLDYGTGYVPEPTTQPLFDLGDGDFLTIREEIMAEIVTIQENVIAYLNNTYGGSIEVFIFPGIIYVPQGTVVNFHNVSTISTGGTALEYVGSGVTYNALPFFGGEPDPTKERVEINNGKCFTVTNDQVGNFRVGGIFNVNALTGRVTISAEDLDLTGISQIGPFRRNGVPVGVVLKEVSNNPLLISSTGIADINTVPTQVAVREYVEDNYLNKVQSVTPQTVQSDVAFEGDLAVNGGDVNTTSTTFNLINENAETVNFAGDANSIVIGASSGSLNIRNLTVDIDGTLNVDGDEITTSSPTFNLIESVAETVLFAHAATDLSMGSITGFTYVRNNLDVGINVNVVGDSITTNSATFNLVDTTATTVNFAGEATELNLASNTGNTNVLNSLNVDINSRLGIDTNSINTINGSLAINIKDNTPDVFDIKEAGNIYIRINTDDSLESIQFGTTPKYEFQNTTEATSTTVASATFAGGVGIAKKLFVGSDLDVDGSTTLGTNLTDTHDLTGSLNVSVPDNTASVFEIIENSQSYIKVDTTNGNEAVRFGPNPTVYVGSIVDSTSKDTGALIVEGGVGVEKNVNVGGNLGVTSNATIGIDLAVNGGTVTTTSALVNLFNDTATTVNFAGAASTINIGTINGTLTINNAQVIFNSTDSIQLPVGTVAERDPTPSPGQIRYNSELSSFEGFGPGGNWGSLGGVKDVDGNTYIIPETAPAANENILYFYNDGTQTLTLSETLFDLKSGVDAVINSPTISTSKTTGALVVVGGVGIGGTVHADELVLTTDLEVQYGGTGVSTFTTNGILYGNAADPVQVTAASVPGSNATTSYGILTTDINNVPVWTDVIDGGSY